MCAINCRAQLVLIYYSLFFLICKNCKDLNNYFNDLKFQTQVRKIRMSVLVICTYKSTHNLFTIKTC